MDELEKEVAKKKVEETMNAIFDLQHLAPLPIELFSVLSKAEFKLALYLKELTE